MATDEILQSERRERPRMAIVAALAAIFTLAGPIVGRALSGTAPDNLPALLLFLYDNRASQLASAALSMLGALGIAWVLAFLFGATRARNPELPALIRLLPWIGGVGVAVFGVAYQIALAINVERFATEGSQTYEEARAAVEAGVPPLLNVPFQLVLALAIVMISVNAMRVGLLTRFLGYLGVISGVLFLIALVPIPIVQVYWLAALALLFAGRSLTGPPPPAWQSGEAIPWPTAAEMREQRVRDAEARRGGGSPEPEQLSAPADAPPAEAPGQRRKRKKRR